MPDKTKALMREGFKRKTVVNKSISEGVITISFGVGRGVSDSKNILKLPQTGGSSGNCFARQDKNSCQGGFQKRKTVGDTSISERVTTTSFGAGRGVSAKKQF